MKDDEWEELEERCASTTWLYIIECIINNVMDKKDSVVDFWNKLKKIYLAKSLSNKLYLKRQLDRLKMEEGKNLMDYMSTFNGILDQL